MHRLRIALVGLFLPLLLIGLAPAPVQAASVDPPQAPPRTTLTFAASGFASGEPVNFWVRDPNGVLLGSVRYQVLATSAGAATWQWRIPRGAQPGAWLMVARGRESGSERFIPFEVLLPAEPDLAYPPRPIASVSPAVGAPGTRFAFVARDFRQQERAAYWLNTPDGRIVSERSFSVETDDREAAWTWQAPADAPRGMWQMVIRGTDSQRERVIFFEVR